MTFGKMVEIFYFIFPCFCGYPLSYMVRFNKSSSFTFLYPFFFLQIFKPFGDEWPTYPFSGTNFNEWSTFKPRAKKL